MISYFFELKGLSIWPIRLFKNCFWINHNFKLMLWFSLFALLTKFIYAIPLPWSGSFSKSFWPQCFTTGLQINIFYTYLYIFSHFLIEKSFFNCSGRARIFLRHSCCYKIITYKHLTRHLKDFVKKMEIISVQIMLSLLENYCLHRFLTFWFRAQRHQFVGNFLQITAPFRYKEQLRFANGHCRQHGRCYCGPRDSQRPFANRRYFL